MNIKMNIYTENLYITFLRKNTSLKKYFLINLFKFSLLYLRIYSFAFSSFYFQNFHYLISSYLTP